MTKQKTNAAAALLAKRGEIKEQIEALKTDACVLRTRIAALRSRRDEIANRPLSKNAFIEMACAWVDKKADAGMAKLSFEIVKNGTYGIGRSEQNIPSITRLMSMAEPGRIVGVFTGGDPAYGETVKEDSLFLFLRDPMKNELRKMAEQMTWPFDDVIEDVDAAQAEIDNINTEIEGLNAELVGLVELGASFGATI